MAISLYSDLDKDRNGNVISEYPAWYFQTQLDNLSEDIFNLKNRLDRGLIPTSALEESRAELARMKGKLEAIEKSRPKLSTGERDRLWKLWKEELCPKISNSMFTYTDMKKGLADANEEARRMVKPVIDVTEELGTLVTTCGGRVEKGKVSRNSLAKVFKIVGRLLGEPSNIEVLRKDRLTDSIKLD